MTILVASTLFWSVGVAGNEMLLPLFVTRGLGYDAGDWAHLCSVRRLGALVGVIILGALSDRFGQRLVGAIAMLGVGASLVGYGQGPPGAIWAVMPFFGALMSTSMVNLDVLTQQVSDRRQGLVNGVCRSIGAAAAIGMPVLATGLVLVWHGYGPVFVALAALMAAAAVLLLFYPDAPVRSLGGGFGDELRGLWAGYKVALRQGPLVRFLLVANLWVCVLVSVNVFAAIRFTQELGQSDQWFGRVVTLAGAAALLATASTGLFLDRVSLRRVIGVGGVLAGVCAALLGANDSPRLSAALFIIWSMLSQTQGAPISMWVSRAAGEGTQTAAFSVNKVLNALFFAAVTAALGELERRVGIKAVFLGAGVLGTVLGFAFFALAEPPRPRAAWSDPAAPAKKQER
jgi:sugar phosphate permease